MQKALIHISLLLLLTCCGKKDHDGHQSVNTTEQDALEMGESILKPEMEFEDIIYVPIYSDIYVDATNPKSLLAATLSIRNTSFTDSLFVSKIDYYNTEGKLVRRYLDKPVGLRPMATISYVIEREDNLGGSGANFIVKISARNESIKPIIQAIMIGQYGNKGFSFSTDGYSVK